ncbi:hypothetical protein [Mycobacterium marinum]|uniref:hypothetical protein n=1 Tax=Mycobacterium marinum TaxID=1781 RepID=UPI0021C379D2|nr:hypothetical protein [Mycobacterium marinum]MDC8973263.1 hypothetical protein [Mycobacterium marinum]
MRKFDRINIAVVASAGLCGAAFAFSPSAAATPLRTGGPSCVEQMAGVGAPAAGAAPVMAPILPGPPVAGAVPVAGGPLLPVPAAGPVPIPAPAPVPAGAPVPLPAGAPVPVPVAVGAPVPAAAPAPAAAPLLLQAGGKGEPTAIDPALTADPVVLPGPPPAPAPAPPAPTVVTGATLAAATQPVAPCCNP